MITLGKSGELKIIRKARLRAVVEIRLNQRRKKKDE